MKLSAMVLAASVFAMPAHAAVVDGTLDASYGAAKAIVTYNAAAPDGTFAAPTAQSNSVGFSVYLSSDASWTYGFLQATGPLPQPFANVYFDFDSGNGANSDAGFEITNQNLIFGGSTYYYPGAIQFAYGTNSLEFAVSNAFFAPGNHGKIGDTITLRMGQIFGYSVVGGTDGLGSVVVGSAVPEPASWAMMIAGFGMVGATLRSRRKLAVSVA